MRRICDDKATSNCLAFGIHRNPPRLIARLAADRRLPLKTAGYYSELLPDRFGNQLTQIERETRWLTFGRALMEQKEFAEFIWADWMRNRAELRAEQIAAAPDKMLNAAVKLAKSPVAAGLPGYVGNEPPSFTCPDDE
jgi:hypothetical protein